jgi:hypothetical protein
MHRERKLDNTIIKDKPWTAKNRILSTTSSKPTGSRGSLS